MDTRTSVEMPGVSEETRVTDSGSRTETVKLVEMGDVSVETKGMFRGLELGLLPKS